MGGTLARQTCENRACGTEVEQKTARFMVLLELMCCSNVWKTRITDSVKINNELPVV